MMSSLTLSVYRNATEGASFNPIDMYKGSTQAGSDALDFYAQRWVETGNPVYLAGGTMAAWWTPETAPITATTLSIGWSVAGWAARTGGAAAVPQLEFAKQGNNYFKVIDKANKLGFRVDKAHTGHAAKGLWNAFKRNFAHPEFWSW